MSADWANIRDEFPDYTSYPDASDPASMWNFFAFDGTVHLSTRDLAALADGFLHITIGRDGVTERMLFGDAKSSVEAILAAI